MGGPDRSHSIRCCGRSRTWCVILSAVEPLQKTETAKCDFLIVTALHKELAAAIRVFNASPLAKAADDAIQYYQASLETRFGSTYELRFFCSGGAGPAPASATLVEAITRWKPTHVLLIGIAATIPGDGRELGAVLIADQIVDLSHQKVLPARDTIRSWFVPCDAELVSAARDFLMQPWRRPAHVGAVISQNALVKSAEFRDFLSDVVQTALDRPAIGIEMEGGGCASAVQTRTSHIRPGFMVVKAAVDFANYDKDDSIHAQACEDAAQFTLDFLHHGPIGKEVHRQPVPAAANIPEPEYQSPRHRDIVLRLRNLQDLRQRQIEDGQETDILDEKILSTRRELRDLGVMSGDILANGRIDLIDIVGTGGFADVWRAYDRSSRETVAVKILHPQYARDATRRERFIRGARKMAELRHPNIVRVFGGAEQDGPSLYYVMELLPDGDLESAILKKRLAGTAALRVVIEAAQGLQHAHEQGLIHRDVSPSNVLLRGQHALVTDFDLVWALDTTGGTRTGTLGKAFYAAPELMDGAANVDVRADIYSLAMSAAFCLHGRPLDHSVVRDPAAFIHSLSCTRSLKRVIQQGIDWDRNKRFASIQQFSKALEQALLAAEVQLTDGQTNPGGVVSRDGRILIVEDDKVVAEILHDFLMMEGYQCYLASSAEAAEQKLAKRRYDMVILDLRLEGKSGVEFLALAGKTWPELIVITVTGFSTYEVVLEVMKLGAADHLLKPFKIEDVVFTVEQAFLKNRTLGRLRRD